LQPYYDKLFNLSLERLVLLNPNTYKKLKEEVKNKGLIQEMKIKLAKIYGQLEKFLDEIYNLNEFSLIVMTNRYAIQLKLINDFLYQKVRIRRLLPDYEYKFQQFPPNIGLDEFLQKLEIFRQSKLSFDIISELVRMREQAAARVLFLLDLRGRYQILQYDIFKYMDKIRKFFDNPKELDEIYKKYVYPYFDTPKIQLMRVRENSCNF
jgi:hypothetical protein